MRIAVLADIHGNLPAFEAALDHLSSQHVDQIIIAGDIVGGGVDSAACWRLAQTLECPIIRGNHERYVAYYGTPDAPPAWQTEQFAPVRWAVRQCTADERSAMRALPLALCPADAPGVLIVHASLRADRDTVAAHTPEAELAEMFAGAREALIIRAHNHVQAVRLWGERLIVTAGSVGLPLNGSPTAQYLILNRCRSGWQFEHHAVPYDVDAAVRRFHESGYLAAAGPMGRLYLREVATATLQLVPFLRAYARWSAEGAMPLDAAVERFLTM